MAGEAEEAARPVILDRARQHALAGREQRHRHRLAGAGRARRRLRSSKVSRSPCGTSVRVVDRAIVVLGEMTLSCRHAEFHPEGPAAAQRAGPGLRPRIGGKKVAQARARDDGASAASRSRCSIGGERRKGPGTADVLSPHAHKKVLAKVRAGLAPTTSSAAIAAALAAQASWARDAAARAARRSSCAPPSCSPTKYRPILNAATMLGPVQDGAPGRDRRRLRVDRLLALERALRRAHRRRAAVLAAGDVEPARGAAARGLRLRGDAVQLHVHRRQPADGAGDDGQHRGVEAGAHRDAVGALHHGAPARGRAARRRHQLRARARRRRSATRCLDPSRSGRRPLHRLDRRVPDACGRRSARTSPSYRTYPRLVGETGGKDFILAHPSADRRGARRRHRARRLRVPGAEVLGGLARLRARVAVEGRPARPRAGAHRRAPRGRRRATSATSWARSSTSKSFEEHRRLRRRRPRTRRR